ncbi:MAG: tagaturonate reductase [Ruminococcaceae bacterium]|nr:tagaturonate reductase [Oscillospiraceae bacterium]
MKILQFGEGNFLRAFVDYMIDFSNEKLSLDNKVTIVKPIEYGSLDAFKEQNCQYTLITRGMTDGQKIDFARKITCVDKAIGAYEDFDELLSLAKDCEYKIVISNTTEAGIAITEEDSFEENPPKSYPAKLTRFLYERFCTVGGEMYILPCELIENNGQALEKCVMETAKRWKLCQEFLSWLSESCYFCTTLVDRIVTGFNKELSEQYKDKLLDIGEPFALWVIEDKGDIRKLLPLDKAGLDVVFTDDVTPYRERKVRILNGAHTSTVLAAYLAGKTIVRECIQDSVILKYMKKCILDEVIPTLSLDKEDCMNFAKSVFERFENPFIDHSLLSISLNSVSKWKSRLLGSFKDYYKKFNTLPPVITFSFAAMIAFYSKVEEVKDDKAVLEFFEANKADSNFVEKLCQRADFWGEDLSLYPDFCKTVQENLKLIEEKGMYEAMRLAVDKNA